MKLQRGCCAREYRLAPNRETRSYFSLHTLSARARLFSFEFGLVLRSRHV